MKTESLLDGAVLRRDDVPEAPQSRAKLSATEVPTTSTPRGVKPPTRRGPRKLFEGAIVKRAIADSFKKLDPRHQFKNPVMFVVEVGSLFTTVLFLQSLVGKSEASPGFILAISLWLWFTVLFANFAEAMAEGRGKAQAETLRQSRKDSCSTRPAQSRSATDRRRPSTLPSPRRTWRSR